MVRKKVTFDEIKTMSALY